MTIENTMIPLALALAICATAYAIGFFGTLGSNLAQKHRYKKLAIDIATLLREDAKKQQQAEARHPKPASKPINL